MRIAVCMSGFLRTWEHTKKSFLEQICKNAEVDVFLHTYSINMYEFTAGNEDVFYTENQIRELFKDVNLKGLVIEDRDEMMKTVAKEAERFSFLPNWGLMQQESSDSKSKSVPIGVRTYDHLRKLNECNKLRQKYEKENNFKYDLVMKTRPDIVYFNTPNWEMCMDGKVHCGYGATWGWPEDTVCITIPKIMDTAYANRFEYLDKMYNDPDYKEGICAHKSLDYMYKLFNIEIGNPAVNISCFRSKNSFQYYSNYKKKCDLDWLYREVTKYRVQDPVQVEQIKKEILPPV